MENKEGLIDGLSGFEIYLLIQVLKAEFEEASDLGRAAILSQMEQIRKELKEIRIEKKKIDT